MKIAGFNFTKKQIVIFAIVIGVICLFVFISGQIKAKQEEEEYQRRMAEIEAENAAQAQASDNNAIDSFDYDAELQKSLVEEYGEPPEGFEWSMTGELIALSDSTMTAEDVVYTFLRSLSILDFSTAQRYSIDSSVVSNYSDFYSELTKDLTDYYDDFLRKQYKFALTTLEIEDVQDTAVFADGTEYVTVQIKSLDLTDKDFWQSERDALFEQLRVYKDTEEDDAKLEKYIYDYIYRCYEDGRIGKKLNTIELVLTKDNGKGWLVQNDGELNSVLAYTWGVDVAAYIREEFDDWLLNKHLDEM